MLQKLKQVSISSWLSFSFFLLVLYALFNGFYSLKHWLTNEKSLPITALVLTGDSENVSRESVIDVLVKQEDELNFFTLEIFNVQKQLEALPWVYSVSIRKYWPDTLKIHIVEQAIVASWNNNALLNKSGEVIDIIPSEQDDYIALSGEDGQSEEVLDIYRQLKVLLAPTQYRIAALSSDRRNSSQLVLQNGIVLRLGKELKLERIQLFLKAFPRIIQKYKINTIEYVDLRYDTGLAIGWKSTEQNDN